MSGAASALFFLDIKGRVLVWRDYRGDVTAAQAEKCFTKLIDKEVYFQKYLQCLSFSAFGIIRFRNFSYCCIGSIFTCLIYLLISKRSHIFMLCISKFLLSVSFNLQFWGIFATSLICLLVRKCSANNRIVRFISCLIWLRSVYAVAAI